MRNEINLREVRARIGYLVERAEHAGEITIITRHGHQAAAIVPIHLIPQESTVKTHTILASDGSEADNTATWMIVDDTDCLLAGVEWRDGDTIDDAIARFVKAGELPAGARLERQERMHNPYPWQPSGYAFRWTIAVPEASATTVSLYETNSDILVIARGDDAWTLQVAGTHMVGHFAADAEAWINGDWEPNEGDGQNPTHLDDLNEVATWDAENGVTLLTRADSLGGAAREYLPEINVEGVTFTRDNDNPEWGTDTITITVNGNEVTETFTVDGISDKNTRSFPSGADEYLRTRRIDLVGDGYTEA